MGEKASVNLTSNLSVSFNLIKESSSILHIYPNPTQITSVDSPPSEATYNLCTVIRNKINGSEQNGMKIYVALIKDGSNSYGRIPQRILEIRVVVGGSLVDYLRKLVGNSFTKMGLQIELSNFRECAPIPENSPPEIAHFRENFTSDLNEVAQRDSTVESKLVIFPNNPNDPSGCTADMKIRFATDVQNVPKPCIPLYRPPTSLEFLEMMKDILDKQFETDTVIIAENGTEIGCHKIFLTANSPVFQTMFQKAEMQEAKTKTIRMDDMSENGVRALLAYLYHLNVDRALEDFDAALELLEASEKYFIERLKTQVKNIFMDMPNNCDWFSTSNALRLFVYARNANGCSELKQKAAEVLKFRHEELPENEDYKQLFDKDRSAAMDLCYVISKS